MSSDTDTEGFDPRRRRLCPDGDCVGLVGPDGHCRVCGQFDTGAAGLGAEAFGGGCASEVDDDLEAADSGHHTGEHDEPGPSSASFDPARPLCPDGSCIGVLSDGRCTVCGVAPGTA